MVLTCLVLSTRAWLKSIWVTHNGAMRWIDLGVTEFQPSELAKVAIILCFASMITIYGPQKMHTLKYGTLPFIGILGVACGLMALQPHISGIVIIGVIGLVMMYIGGTNIFWLLLGGGSGAVAVIYLIFVKGYAMDRIRVWLDPFIDPQGDGWQG